MYHLSDTETIAGLLYINEDACLTNIISEVIRTYQFLIGGSISITTASVELGTIYPYVKLISRLPRLIFWNIFESKNQNWFNKHQFIAQRIIVHCFCHSVSSRALRVCTYRVWISQNMCNRNKMVVDCLVEVFLRFYNRSNKKAIYYLTNNTVDPPFC